jgi:uncharacterized RDD family membrane protein YckC
MKPAIRPAVFYLQSAMTGIVGAAYFVVGWNRYGSTVGQRLLGLRVTSVITGKSPTFGRSIARWLALGAPLWIAAVLLPGILGLSAVCACLLWSAALLWTTARGTGGQGLHDRWTGTLVARPMQEAQAEASASGTRLTSVR